jgi:inorganic triphosphatase YgiF
VTTINTPTPVHAEREAKFVLSAEQYAAFLAAVDLLGETLPCEIVERQRNTYYDTATRALERAKSRLRARRIDGEPGVTWTFKGRRLPGSGLAKSRPEYEAWADDEQDPQLAAWETQPMQFARGLADGPLLPVNEQRTERVVRPLWPNDTDGLVEVAIDKVTIPDHPEFVRYELELEDKGIGRRGLESLALRVQQVYGLTASAQGKQGAVLSYLRSEAIRREAEAVAASGLCPGQESRASRSDQRAGCCQS